jgi:hypothetical protein
MFMSIVIVVMMMGFVFIGSPHCYIGFASCMYFLYRYASLAFSNPGLARTRPFR